MDAQTQAWFDQYDASLTETIRRHGWFIQYVSGEACPYCDDCSSEGPSFAYTVGLFGLAHPELLILGLPSNTAGTVLNTLGDRIRGGEALLPGQLITFEDWQHRVIPERVPNPGEIVLKANEYYRRRKKHSVPVLQLSYDDVDGKFPWEEGYAAPEIQPRPGPFKA